MLVNGHPCHRRVVKLYLPLGNCYFGCRNCHGLTYTGSQTHDKRVDQLRRDPEALRRALAPDAPYELVMRAIKADSRNSELEKIEFLHRAKRAAALKRRPRPGR